MAHLYLDFETYSETPIQHGTYRYAANAEITLFAWAIGDDPALVWDVTDGSPMPFDLAEALADDSVLVFAHNSMFDRTVMRSAMPALCPPIPRWRDTMIQALAHSLPGALGNLSEILGIPSDKAKDKKGKQLVQLFCKPRPATSKVRRATRDTHPAEWAEFVDYARLDVEAMREAHKRMPMWNYQGDELALWHLDQLINDRGVAVDLDLANAALAAVDAEQKVLAERTVEMTNGEVQSATQRNVMLEHLLAEYGVSLPDLTMATVERRLDDPDIPEAMKDLLRVRLQASTSSTSKYKALVRATNIDGRIRGLLQYNGAARTGRWCIAEGSLVTTLGSDGLISETPIELVKTDDLVWDGDAWVAHEGVVFSGVKDVISHDGVLATAEHNVYTTTLSCITLAQAKEQGIPLWPGNAPTTFTD